MDDNTAKAYTVLAEIELNHAQFKKGIIDYFEYKRNKESFLRTLRLVFSKLTPI